MKKTSKKIISVLIAVMLVITACIPAFAAFAANGKGKITVANPHAGITYDFYKVLDLTWRPGADGQEGTADDIYNYTVVSQYDNFFKDDLKISGWGTTITTESDKAKAVSAYFEGVEDNASKLYDFAREVKKYADSKNIAADYSIPASNTLSGAVTISNVDYGNYVMVPTDESGALDRGSIFSLDTVTPNTTIQDKTYNPSIEKKIKEGANLVDANSAAIGDVVDYRLTTEVPKMNGYTKYTFKITDNLSAGLKFASGFAKKDVTVTIGGAAFSAFTVNVKTNNDGTSTLVIDFSDFIGSASKAGQTILIDYSAIVDDDAVIGTNGNPNDVYLTYSNNPSVESSTDDTIIDEVKTYVAGFQFTKVDEQGRAIDGATFKLTGANLDKVNVKNGAAAKTTVDLSSTKEYTVTTDSTGKVLFEGLKEGTYTLTEIAAPYGYLALNEPITITITCTEPAEVVYGENTQCTFTAAGNKATSLENGVVSALSDQTTGVMKFNVVNHTQSGLPATGATGFLTFLGIGVTVIAAGILLASKKNKKASSNA